MQYTDDEMMVTTAARELHDEETVLVGIGIPNLACTLAKRMHAPDVRMVYESGVVDADPDALPLSIGDPVLVSGSSVVDPMFDGFSYYLQGGNVDVGFLGGAQIDRHGNINSTVIGEYDDPDVRLPGSGGACEIASNAGRTIIITQHSQRYLPAEVDFVTSPGYVGGREGRRDLGLPGGPDVLITDKAVMRFDESGEMYVDSVHPGVDFAEAAAGVGWDIDPGPDLTVTDDPGQAELDTIRTDLDPDGTYIDHPDQADPSAATDS